MTPTYTDTRLPAIREHVERQLARGDIVTLTRGQALALLGAAESATPTGVPTCPQ